MDNTVVGIQQHVLLVLLCSPRGNAVQGKDGYLMGPHPTDTDYYLNIHGNSEEEEY